MTDHLKQADKALALHRENYGDTFLGAAVRNLLAHLRATASAATAPHPELPDTLKAFRDWTHDDSGISSTYQLTRNQARQLLSWAGIARRGRVLQRPPLVLDDAEEKPAEADVSDEPDDEELDALYVSEARKHFNDHSCAQRALWRDGFAKGRSSAARELAEKDERIRELEAQLKAWEPFVTVAQELSSLVRTADRDGLGHNVTRVERRIAEEYDAIPANLRPGAEREG